MNITSNNKLSDKLSDNTKSIILIALIAVLAGTILSLVFVAGVSQPVEGQSGYTVDIDFTEHDTSGDFGKVQTADTIENDLIASGNGDGEIIIWEYKQSSYEIKVKIPAGDLTSGDIYDVERIDEKTLYIATRSDKDKIITYDSDAGTYTERISVNEGLSYDATLLDDGRILLSSFNNDGTVKIIDYDINSGSYTVDLEKQLQGSPKDSVKLSEEKTILTGTSQYSIIWNYKNGQFTEEIKYTNNNAGIWAVEKVNQNTVAVAGDSGDLRIFEYDLSSGSTTDKIIASEHSDTIRDVKTVTGGNILTASWDSTGKLINYNLNSNSYQVNEEITSHSGNLYSADSLTDGRLITSAEDSVKIWDAGLPAATNRIADPVAVTDVQQSSEDFTFYAVGNSDVSSSDTLTWEFGDGTNTTAQANETVTHNYNTHGRYTVNVTTSDGNTRSTEVVVHSQPSVSNIIDPNPALEGESISLDGSGSDALTTAARPTPSQLTVTTGLRSWIPYNDTSSIDDSLYNGWIGDGVDLGSALSHDNPTGLYSIYSSSDGDESYITNPVDLQTNWTISTFVAAGSNSVAPVWLSSSGHGVYFDNGDLKRVYPSGSEIIGQVDPSAGGVNLTVTHDSSGSFTYYVDGNEIGSDTYSSTVNDATYITQAPNSIDGKTQDTDVYMDNWRIYDRVLSQNEIDLIDDSYTVQTLSETKLYYNWELDGSTISTSSTHTINGLQAGNYTIKLTVQDNDGLVSTSSKTLEVKDVVAPRIDNVSPAGDLNQRDIDIQADVSHPQIGSNYEVEVVLTRVNQQTGQTKTLVTKNITSNQVVNYDATHTNTGVENYNVNREYFEYEWTAQEPQQGLTESSGIKRYSIPVAEVIINNVNTEGLQSSRDVDLSADIDGTVTSSLDVRLELYDLREDETTTEYQTTINSAQTVSTTISHSLNRTAVPSDYRTQNRYSYQWVVTTDSGTTERSQTRDYLIPGLIYPVNENANLVGGVEDIINVADLTAEQDDYEISRSGKYNSSVFLPDFSRSYTALMYDTTDSAVFNKTFSADNEAFDFSGINLKDAYLVLSTEIGDNTYGVSAKRFQNGNVTLDVKDGVEYFVSVTDGETRRSVGPYIADKDNKDESQSVSPDSLDFQETEQIQSQVSTTYDSENETGSITIEWSAGDKEVENLRVEVIRDDDDKIIFRDSVGGRVENYKNTVAISDVNSTYTTNFEYYLVNESKTVTSSEKVTIKFQQVLDGLPDWMTTALGVVILLMMTFILGEISAAYGLVAVVAAGGVMTVIGWLPISITVVMQAGLVAILYFIQSDSTVT